MKILALAYVAYIALAVLFVATCSRHITEPAADPLARQHRLSEALDSVDRAACGAPKGCRCVGLVLDCPDPKPGEP